MGNLPPQPTEKPIYTTGIAEKLKYIEKKRRELDAIRQTALSPKGQLQFAELEAYLNDLERRARLGARMAASSLDILK